MSGPAISSVISSLATSSSNPLPLDPASLAHIAEFVSVNAATLSFTTPQNGPASDGLPAHLDKAAIAKLPPQVQQLIAAAASFGTPSPPVCTTKEKEVTTDAALLVIRASTAITRRFLNEVKDAKEVSAVKTALADAKIKHIADSMRGAASILRLFSREQSGSTSLYSISGIAVLAASSLAMGQTIAAVSGFTSVCDSEKETMLSLISAQKELLMVLVNTVKLSPMRGRDAVRSGILQSLEYALVEPPLLEKFPQATTETCFVAGRVLFLICGTAPQVDALDQQAGKNQNIPYSKNLLNILLKTRAASDMDGPLESRVAELDINNENEPASTNEEDIKKQEFKRDVTDVIVLALTPFIDEFISKINSKTDSTIREKLQSTVGEGFLDTAWPKMFSANSCTAVINDLYMATFAILSNQHLADHALDLDTPSSVDSQEAQKKLINSLTPLIDITLKLLTSIPTSVSSTLEPPFNTAISFLMNLPYGMMTDETKATIFPTSATGNTQFCDTLITILNKVLSVLPVLTETDPKGNVKITSRHSILQLAQYRNSIVVSRSGQDLEDFSRDPRSASVPSQGGAATEVDAQLAPLILLIQSLSKNNQQAFDYFKSKLIPADLVRDKKPLDQQESLTGRCVKLLSNPVALQNSRNCMGNLILSLFDGAPGPMAQYCGQGNVAGYFLAAGISFQPEGGKTTVDENGNLNSIDAITGGVVDEEAKAKLKAEWEALTDDQREQEAEKLFTLFDKLNKTGVFKVDYKKPPPN